GTKIGINEDEYIDLRDEVENFNNLNNTNFKFIWITDGNFWLTYEGEKKYNNLKNYFKEEYELLNYNLFREYLKKFL
ncbi:MAG TPA: DpnII family type II restriction endonuclease, partial [Spirochaetota bacterium]|nr:DpnII family type II restriction endonuclease [Spirochaetota bacterium]